MVLGTAKIAKPGREVPVTRAKITFTGAQETLLATLYGRALDYRSPSPVLGDAEADRLVRDIDYDWRKAGISRGVATGVAARAKLLDDWTAEFLAACPESTVLHLACGLDTRAHRLGPPASVRWFDVDQPEVIDLRRRLMQEPEGDYQMIGSSVTDDDWLESIPADRPVVAVFEGLSMYLREEEGRRLIERITTRFPSGRVLFDCYSKMGIRLQKLVPTIRRTGARLYWGIDDPHELERWHVGLTCLDAIRALEMPGLGKAPLSERARLWVADHIPGVRNAGFVLRYGFG